MCLVINKIKFGNFFLDYCAVGYDSYFLKIYVSLLKMSAAD